MTVSRSTIKLDRAHKLIKEHTINIFVLCVYCEAGEECIGKPQHQPQSQKVLLDGMYPSIITITLRGREISSKYHLHLWLINTFCCMHIVFSGCKINKALHRPSGLGC